jgi:hypothetical protein
MGDFIPSPYDQEIVARLNNLFDHHLTAIKNHKDNDPNNPKAGPQNTPLFPAASLSRVARRIGAYPNLVQAPSQSGGLKNPRARWYVFLDQLPQTTKNAINLVITTAIQQNAAGIVFDLTHEAQTPNGLPYVVLDSHGQPIQATLPDNSTVYCLTLVCQDPIPESTQVSPVGGTFNNPTNPANQQGNEVAINLPWGSDNNNY